MKVKLTYLLVFIMTVFTKLTFAWDEGDGKKWKQYLELYSAVEQGDVERFQKLSIKYSWVFDSVSEPEGAMLYNTPTIYRPKAWWGPILLTLATNSFESSPHRIPHCKPQIISSLVERGMYVRNPHLLGAAQLGCIESIELLMSKLSEQEIANSTIGFLKFYKKLVEAPPVDVDEEKIERYVQIMQILGKYIKEKCPDLEQDTVSCEARKYAKELFKYLQETSEREIAQAKQDAARTAYINSPAGLLELACKIQNEIAQNESEIERENEVAKVSGVTSNLARYQAGKTIVQLRNSLAQIKKQYKQSSKKEMNLKSCP
jgi:hypothetical protein